jgi:DNA-binding SARP family transcriptional activator
VLEFRILGPLEAVDDGVPIRLGGPRQRATLAILLLNANRIVSIERLADDLYAGAPPVTAVTQVQRQVSELRKAFGAGSTIETRAPGYVVRLAPEQLDLTRFEQQAAAAGDALGRGEPEAASRLLRDALALWRGPPLADVWDEPFARPAIERLQEIRLAAVGQRIEAELVLARHVELVGELEQLVFEHPLHERFRGQLMLALYRSGRQAEALDVYRRTRHALVEEFGIEPTPMLQKLERAILTQDPSLDLGPPATVRTHPSTEPAQAVLVLPSDEDRLDGLLAIAEPLAKVPGRELIIACLVEDETELESAASTVNARRSSLAIRVRTAAFTTLEPAHDVVRLGTTYDVELTLLDAPPGLDADRLPGELVTILERSPADVGIVSGTPALDDGAGMFVPFGGGEHDWAALELGAWLASAAGAPLRLVGTNADPQSGQRDASRLLADASLAVQRVVGVNTEPMLAEPTEEALMAAVEPATLVVMGISPRWKREGIGAARRALVQGARCPILLVHRGPRPGGLAPRESPTRFTWSIEARVN